LARNSGWYATEEKDELDKLKATQATLASNKAPGDKGTVVDKDIADAEALLAKVQGHIAADQWAQVVMDGRQLDGMITAGKKAAARRTTYDVQRKATMQAFDKIKDNPKLTSQVAAVRASIEAADDMATRSAMRFEAAAAKLVEVTAECAKLEKVAKLAEDYAKERETADRQFETLKKVPAAKHIGPQIKAIGDWLKAATQAVGGTV